MKIIAYLLFFSGLVLTLLGIEQSDEQAAKMLVQEKKVDEIDSTLHYIQQRAHTLQQDVIHDNNALRELYGESAK